MAADQARAPQGGALEVMRALALAKGFDPTSSHPVQDALPGPATAGSDPAAVTYGPGGLHSPYPWTVARCGDFALALCPDPESRGEGITPAQLLVVVEEMLIEWAKLSLYLWPVHEARIAAKATLTAEVKRVAIARGQMGE